MQVFAAENFEGGSNGANITTANTSFDLINGTVPTFINDPYNGTLAMSVVVGGTAAQSNGRFTYGAGAQAVVYRTFAFKCPSAVPTTVPFLSLLRTSTTEESGLRLNSGGTLGLRNVGTLVYTSATAIVAGGYYVIEQAINQTTGKQTLRIWKNGTLLEASPPQSYTGTTITNGTIGNCTSIASVGLEYDWIFDTSQPVMAAATPVVNVAALIRANHW